MLNVYIQVEGLYCLYNFVKLKSSCKEINQG